jgi:hypothetical protein
MQTLIDALRDRQKASASEAPSTLEERRAAFIQCLTTCWSAR